MIQQSRELLNKVGTVRALVVGDTMLDRYWIGGVERISPEAPVPVVSVAQTKECAGGAGNVAANIASLGASCELLSFIGEDDAGRRLNEILEQAGVGRHLHIDPKGRTTEKLRIVSRNQQLLRVDFESRPGQDLIAQSVSDFEALCPKVSVVVISDYGKGGLGHVVEMVDCATRLGKPIIIDPKGTDFTRYRGASVVTPNRHEFETVTGVSTAGDGFHDAAFNLIEAHQLGALLVTQGAEGMTLFTATHEVFHQDARAIEVFDVSGAGDTVVAILALCLGLSLDWQQCLELATHGASSVVTRFGTSVVTPQDFVGSL